MSGLGGFYDLVYPVSDLPNLPLVLVAGGGIVGGLLALIATIILARLVLKADAGSKQMQDIAKYIQEGAEGFLRAEYLTLSIFVAIAGLGIGLTSLGPDPNGWKTMICFIVGATVSGLTGLIGMSISTRANVRTTAAACDAKPGQAASDHGLNAALRVAFNSGSVMGLSVIGLGILALSIMYFIFPDFSILSGFGFGASSIALFARVGGGIFTKAADVGSDLVGKVEEGIPEDDPRNPGVIADNVGDNVGDVAGMGADLFESYVGSIIATGALGVRVNDVTGYAAPHVALPFWIASCGVIASIVGVLTVRTKEKPGASKIEQQNSLLWAIRIGIISSAVVLAGLSVAPVLLLGFHIRVWGCIVLGLLAGVFIGFATEYATSFAYSPVKRIAYAGKTGPATVIIEGLSVGMNSAVPPVLIIMLCIVACIFLAGVYGVALAAVGMLSTLGVTLATDAYGPVADNAGGIAEMSPDVEHYVRERTDALDALGNTTAATGKGFAIGSAVLTALALMTAYTQAVGIHSVDNLMDIMVIPGTLIGAMLPFQFAAQTMSAVGKAAMEMVEEIRRQFREVPGLREGQEGAKADYQRCVDISMRGALRQMILPGIVAVLSPIIVGLIMGSKALAGMLTGAIISGFLLAVTMANAGGAWDNAKKFVEGGGIRGVKKGSVIHGATVVGDTVGDPFKDTSGPALNILIKLMSIISLMLAPLFKAEGPFQAPQWWVGTIILGVALVALAIYWVVQMKIERAKTNDIEMQSLLIDEHEEEGTGRPSMDSHHM